jgi:hypothetical protein
MPSNRFNNGDVQTAVLAALRASAEAMTAAQLVAAVKPHGINTVELFITVALGDLEQSELIKPSAPGAKSYVAFKHGDERNRREETTEGAQVTMLNAATGATVYKGAGSSQTRTVVEKFCAGCERWFEVKGLDILFWNEEHRAHA